MDEDGVERAVRCQNVEGVYGCDEDLEKRLYVNTLDSDFVLMAPGGSRKRKNDYEDDTNSKKARLTTQPTDVVTAEETMEIDIQHTSKNISRTDIQREDDEAIREILHTLKRLVVTVQDDLNVLPLETAMSLLRRELENETHPKGARSILHHHLRRALLTRYSFFGCIEDLEECFSLEEGTRFIVAKGTTGKDIEQVEGVQCAIQLIDECRQGVDIAALDDIIWIAEETIRLYTEGKRGLQQAELLFRLGNALIMRYLNGFGELELTYAANKFREAEYLCGGNVPLAYISLAALAHIGWIRATECGDERGVMDAAGCMGKAQAIDKKGAELYRIGTQMVKGVVEMSQLPQLDEAIDHLTASLSCRMHPHPQRPSTLNRLFNALWTRFQWRGNFKDLEDGIFFNREGLRLGSRHHPDRSMWLNNLGNSHSARFGQKGAFQDLEECILLHREALDLRPPPHPDRSMSLNNLAITLSTRFQQKGAFQDLEECILLYREALDLQPPSHPLRSGLLDNLAGALSHRFGQKGAFQDLEESIQLHREALDLRPPSHPLRSTSLNNLANALSRCFQQKGAFQDLEECILLHREALDLRPPPHPLRSTSLNNLANSLSDRFEQKGTFQDLEECILLHREALGLRPLPHPLCYTSLNNLASALSTRFSQRGAFQDLEESILLHREALDLLPPPHPYRPGSLNNLASALSTRFKQKGTFQDLEECILLHREALNLLPPPHPDRSMSLNNLASALCTRFEQKGTFQNLEECILLHREALDLQPPPHPLRDTSLNNLASALSTRFSQRGAFQDLEESILLHREALDLLPPPHPHRSASLDNLAGALSHRFEQKGAFQDLEECILLRREALNLRPPPHPDRSTSLNNLANSLSTRFQQKGTFQDLEECILLHREALDLLPPPHPHRSASLDNLAGALSHRFEQKGAFQDLEECVLLRREALNLLPPPHPDRSTSLNNLANSLSTHFQQKGTFQDLEECILLHREALDLRPPPHPHRSASLDNLAGALSHRFEQKGAFQDLEECFLLRREALNLRPPPHPDRSTSLNNLANSLSTRFQQKGTFQDLEECILLHREALDLLPPPHPLRDTSLNNLANSLSARFRRGGAFQDLEECILLHREALNLRPPPHPDRSTSLSNLATSLLMRYPQSNDNTDLEQAFHNLESASRYETGSVLDRLTATKKWAVAARKHRPSAALNAYLYVLELLPLLASVDLTIKQRSDVLEHSRGVIGDAAQWAISQNDLENAVVFLSTGRSTFWLQTLQLRTAVDEVAIIHPTLAQKYLVISRTLEYASHNPEHRFNMEPASDVQVTRQIGISSLSNLASERGQVIDEIRRLPGFENFLLPPSFPSLQLAAHRGPIVFLNVSQFGCDALIMRDANPVAHVALPDIEEPYLRGLDVFLHETLNGELKLMENSQPESRNIITDLREFMLRDVHKDKEQDSVTCEDILQFVSEVLWEKVVRPVILALGLQKTDSPTRIWWCPSGAFASLPIHAAGLYSNDKKPVDCLFQYTVSSYITSPQDLLHPMPQISPEYRITAIIEPEAPGGESLPATEDELLRIKKYVPDPNQLISRVGTNNTRNKVEDVISDIQQSSIVHFGCHGTQNLDDPLESALLLSGGRLTMSRLIRDCQTSNTAALAYLSACETAKGDKDRPDESLNLVATMMFTGFRSVVGTMWSIFDYDAPIVADVFYGHLFRHGKEKPPDVRDAAYGLHLATAELRKQGRGFQSWVPFVHYGI